MADRDLIKLYSGRILELASDIPHLGHLDAPQAVGKARSPHCGSAVSVDLTLTDGQISEFAQDVKACALGQASASIFAASAVGRDRAEVAALREAVRAMLKENGPVPPDPFADYEVLTPAREFRNRHASILLVLDATLQAMDEAAGRACA